MRALFFAAALLVATSLVCAEALRIGKPAPGFTAKAVTPAGKIEKLSLADYAGKYVVLFFYPLDFTFVCPTEILSFSEAAKALKEFNAEVIGVSTDSAFSHLAWTKVPVKDGGIGSVSFPIVSDFTKKISAEYGVLIEEGDDAGAALRGTFIIDDKGNLRQITINDLPVSRNVEDTVRLVRGFQHADKFGEVCPSKWKPGGRTIIPDPDKSKEYFVELAKEMEA